jgi:hypothetical protein
MTDSLEQLANRTVRNVRVSIALASEAQAVRESAVAIRRQAMVLCRFSALERRRRAGLASRQAKPGFVSYLLL